MPRPANYQTLLAAEARERDERREAYANATGLKMSGGHVCISRILSIRCQGTFPAGDGPCHAPASDHLSLWLKDGKPFQYVSQPYGLDHETRVELDAFCRNLGLIYDINAAGSWHAPGLTLLIEIRMGQRDADGNVVPIESNIERNKPKYELADATPFRIQQRRRVEQE